MDQSISQLKTKTGLKPVPLDKTNLKYWIRISVSRNPSSETHPQNQIIRTASQFGSDETPDLLGGAGNEIRTRDTKLGKLVLYQLSYARLPMDVYKTTKLACQPLLIGISR